MRTLGMNKEMRRFSNKTMEQWVSYIMYSERPIVLRGPGNKNYNCVKKSQREVVSVSFNTVVIFFRWHIKSRQQLQFNVVLGFEKY